MIQFEEDVQNCLRTMETSGIILYPTDTIWGLGCDATDEKAIKKIYSLKQRSESKSMIILVSDIEMIHQYVADPSDKILDFLNQQTTPTTAIFDHAINLPSSVVNIDGTIALRIAQDKFCQNLIHKLKRPLISTSANKSGEVYPQNFPEISDSIKNGVDYIVQYRQNDLKKHNPSAIVKLVSDELIRLR